MRSVTMPELSDSPAHKMMVAKTWYTKSSWRQLVYRIGIAVNTGARQCEAAVLASFGVFHGDFMAMMATAREIARMSGENRFAVLSPQHPPDGSYIPGTEEREHTGGHSRS